MTNKEIVYYSCVVSDYKMRNIEIH